MIGVFDSGFGGLTVLASLLKTLPRYDYLFLADSARAPYGARSADVINEFTLEAVEWLFDQGCPLVVLACNTASARALRNLQQLHLPAHRPDRRVLGVVRPSVEALAGLPPGAIPGETAPSLATGTVAVLGTASTIASDSYAIELQKLAPGLTLIQQPCPMWVPLVEAGELDGPGAEYFLRRSLEPVLNRAPLPQRLLLGCTHYPLLLPAIRRLVPASVEILDQGEIVATRLADWLQRHRDHEARLTRNGTRRFVTTDDPAWFAQRGEKLLGRPLHAERVHLRARG
ncbi:glutamate racemase [Opitutus terrae]|uniref:Glutamate racemase n=1 Tax=Opitutus terrae (strain DSM 11246 / JCM 15787 / PB90-1) TaxID=452637 RepID=B1ZP02_OPITP|nr:glutamate racemase [Opitutus terrae]ACB77491.1 glutamate racemase [Opitutus terrae PB90-1]